MRIAANRIASALFTCAAFVPLNAWFVFLFVATPTHQPVWQFALQSAVYTFSAESPATWLFVALAALPLVFIFLAIAAWRAPASAWSLKRGLTMLAIASSAVAGFFIWPAVFLAGSATYLLVGQRHG